MTGSNHVGFRCVQDPVKTAPSEAKPSLPR